LNIIFTKSQKDLPQLEDLLLSNNPLEEKHTAEGNWRDLCMKALPQVKRIDGGIVIKNDPSDTAESA
jgi:dynein light chain 1